MGLSFYLTHLKLDRQKNVREQNEIFPLVHTWFAKSQRGYHAHIQKC